jgi:hypothetical protein
VQSAGRNDPRNDAPTLQCGIEQQLGQQRGRIVLLLARQEDEPWLREPKPSASGGSCCAPSRAASLVAQIVGAGGGAAKALGELRVEALPLIRTQFSMAGWDRPCRRFRESLQSVRFGCATTSRQLALSISQSADSSLTVQDPDRATFRYGKLLKPRA